jgi:hypothetical protein
MVGDYEKLSNFCMNYDLDKEFTRFVRNSYPNGEIVTDTLVGKKIDFKNADYFFNQRNFVMELKTLKEEKYIEVYKIIGELLHKKEIKNFPKGMKIGEILKDHPNKDTIINKISTKITRSLEGALKEANRQIRETKFKFGLKDSQGVAFVVNLDNIGLDPRVATPYLNYLIMKRGVDREYRYEELTFIIYISQVHYFFDTTGKKTMPFYIKARKEPLSQSDQEFLDEFSTKWTEFTGIPVDGLKDAKTSADLNANTFFPKEKDFELIIKNYKAAGRT